MMQFTDFVSGRQDAGKFISMPYDIYRGDKKWIKPDAKTQYRTLFENAKLTQANHVKVLGFEGSSAVFRALLYAPGSGPGYMGFMEFIQDKEKFRQAMEHCMQWFRARNVSSVWAPVDIDTWHRYRFLTMGFKEHLFTNEPYNKEYYPEYIAHCGFTVLEHYHSKVITDPGRVISRLKPKYDKAVSEGFAVESADGKDFDSILKRMYTMSCSIFRDNLGYSGITESEFMNLYAGMKPVAEKNLILIGKSKDGEDAGFIFGYPELNFILGEQNPLLKAVKFAAYRAGYRHGKTVNIKTMGVMEKFRKTRLGSMLVYGIYKNALNSGYKVFNHCLIRDGNYSSAYDGGSGIKNKEYCLYEYKL